MPPAEPFTFIESTKDIAKEGYNDYVDMLSAKVADVDVQFCARLRTQYPDMIISTVPASNVDLIRFARLGYASYELEIERDSVSRLRGYIAAGPKGGEGYVAEVIQYARYNYKWGDEYFVIYWVLFGYSILQYVLKEPRAEGEKPNTNSIITDKLLKAAGDVLYAPRQQPGIWVFDGYWTKSIKMYEEVEKSSWDKIILDDQTRKSLIEVSEKFFNSKDIYADLGVPWKRGLLFHGPPGNGKTISIKALMRTISHRKTPIPTLYVKSAPGTMYIRNVFYFARSMAPCLLVLEDIETIVNSNTRSYFFNEVDGLENNDGILMVASTNFLDRLDPGLSKRPSRFDRKYLFPLPDEHERTQYAEYWRQKVKKNPKINFPSKLFPAIARITDDFSFAYMQEAFVAALLEIARQGSEELLEYLTLDDDDDLDKYSFWRILKEQVKILREDMDARAQSLETLQDLEHDLEVPAMAMSTPSLPGAFQNDRHKNNPDGFPTYPGFHENNEVMHQVTGNKRPLNMLDPLPSFQHMDQQTPPGWFADW